MSHKVKIVTDSSAYLLPESITRYDIRVVLLKIAFGTEVYNEGTDITNEEFHEVTGSSFDLSELKDELLEWEGVYIQ